MCSVSPSTIQHKEMSKIIVLFFIASFFTDDIEAAQCVIPSEEKTRIFDSIDHYEGNKIPFSPLRGGWQGSNVEFNFSVINELSKNIFLAYESPFIISLKLSRKQIKEIEIGAFYNLDCLNRLFLDHNNLTKLTKNSFQYVDHLEKLDLSYNQIEIVKDLVFDNLHRLKILDLSNNKIKTVEILAFNNLTSLEYLSLDRNQIRKIFPDLFRPSVNLTTLILSWNVLNRIEPEKWGGLTNLQTLDLAGNGLDHFDPSYNFSFSNLKSLNLSFNGLTFLNVMEIRRHLPRLEWVDLNNNPWYCDTLERIIHELTDSRITFNSRNFSTVGIHGIACSEVSVYITKSTTEMSSTSTSKNQAWIDQKHLERYVEKKIRDNNEELKSSIGAIRSFVVFIFALVCVVVVLEILIRTNVCGVLLNRLRGGNELYVDDSNDVENFRLLHR